MKPTRPPGVPELKQPRKLRRLRFFGAAMALAGLGLLIYGGLSLIGIYSREQHMVVLEIGLSPEKGQLWVNCVTGASLMLIGIALRLKAGSDSKKTPEQRD